MDVRQPLNLLCVTNHRRFKSVFRAQPWARELAVRGHHVDVICHADTERWRTKIEHVDGFRVVESPDLMVGSLRQGWDPVCAFRRRRFLFREDKHYDLIQCFDTRPAVVWPALAYARAKHIPIVSDWSDWWGRGGLIRERRPLWYQYFFAWLEVFFEEHYRKKLDGLSAISHALLDRALELGVPRERCHRIPGGVNLDVFSEVFPRDESRARQGIPLDVPVLCFSGLDVLIDLGMAVNAYEIVRSSFPGTILLLTGGATERVVRRMLRDPANMSGVKVLGVLPYRELPSHLAAADVFLMPFPDKIANVGRWPNKIGDYMCLGRPTVSNPVGEVKWLFEQYHVGLLAEATPESMADAALRLLRDPELARTMGETARKTAEEGFSWSKLVDDLEDWYYELIRADGSVDPEE